MPSSSTNAHRRRPIGLESLRLTRAAIQAQHQLPAQTLTQRILVDQRLQLPHELGVPPGRQLLLDSLLQTGDAQLLKPGDLGRGEPVRGQVGQRGPPPQRQRLLEPPLVPQPPEPRQVELVVADGDEVSRRLGDQPLPPDQLAQPRDVELQRLVRGFGRIVLPQQVDQSSAGHDAIGLQQQRAQKSALLGGAQVERPPVRAHLEWTQDAELHARPTLPPA